MKIIKDKTFLKILSIVVMLILVYIFFLSGLTMFRIARLKMNDTFLKIASGIKPTPKSQDKIVIIGIDDQSLAVLSYKWPWPRLVQINLLDKLKTYKPKAIGFDLGFIGRSVDENEDIQLAEKLKQSGNCVIAAHFSPEGQYVLPLKIFRDAAKVGFTNKPRDKDNYVRSSRISVLSKKGTVLDYSIETKIVSEFLGLGSIEYHPEKVVLKDTNKSYDIPINEIGAILINYRTKKTDFKSISFWKALNEDLPLDTFKDKIVLVGATAEVIHDIYPTPLGIMPGVAISANTIQTILEKDFIKLVPLWIQRIIILLIGLVVTFFTYRYALAKAFFLNISLLFFVFIGYMSLFMINILGDFSSILFTGMGTFLGISGFSYLRLAIEANILKSQAITDALTDIYGFRYFNLRLKSEFARAHRYDHPLSLIMLDIDHFKQINDTYGHDNGNIVLKKIASMLKSSSRRADVVARFGGEEFCIILPHIKQENAAIYAERIRERVEQAPFVIKGEQTIKVTVSLGVSYMDKRIISNAEELLKAADNALYQAKNSGRNKVCVFRAELPQNNNKPT